MHQFIRSYLALIDTTAPWLVICYMLGIAIPLFSWAPAHQIGGDSPPTIYLSMSIIEHQRMDLSPYLNEENLLFIEQRPDFLIEVQGRYFSKYSIMPSLIGVPFYAPYLWLVPEHDDVVVFIISRFVSMLLTCGVMVLIFLVLRRLLRQWQALLLALMYGLGTQAYYRATNTLASQNTAELMLMITVWMLFCIEEEQNRQQPLAWQRFVLIGLALMISVTTRLHTGALAVLFGLYILQRFSRQPLALLSVALGGVLPLVLFVLYNLTAFSSVLATGYGNEAVSGWSTPVWQGVTNILFSLSHGMLIYCPVLFLSLPGVWVVWQRTGPALPGVAAPLAQAYQYIGRYLSIMCLTHVLIMGSWWAWYGGAAFYTRMLQEIIPFLMLLAGYGWLAYHRSQAFVGALAVASAWSVGVIMMRTALFNPADHQFDPDRTWSVGGMEFVGYWQQYDLITLLVQIGSVALFWGSVACVVSLLFWRVARQHARR